MMPVPELQEALASGAAYAVFAASLALAWAADDRLPLTHGALSLLGAALTMALPAQFGWPLWLALPAAIAASAGAAVAAESLLDRLPHDAPRVTRALLGSLALAGGLTAGVELALGGHAPAAGRLLAMPMVPAWVPLPAGLLVLAVLTAVLTRSAFGRQLRAVMSAPDSARLLGVPVRAVRRRTAALGGALATLAGVLATAAGGSTASGTHLLLAGCAVLMLIGPRLDLRAALLGGLLLGLAEQALAQLSPGVTEDLPALAQLSVGVTGDLPALLLILACVFLHPPAQPFARVGRSQP